MILRGASIKYAKVLDKMLTESKFELTPKHLISSAVIEDEKTGSVIAAGILNTIAEASFLTNNDYSLMARAKALKLLLRYANDEVAARGYDNYHVFATNDAIKFALLKREFKPVTGEVLIKWGS